MPASKPRSRNPLRHSRRLSRTGRWVATGLMGASLAFGSPKARAQERALSPQDSAVAVHSLRGRIIEDVHHIIPPRVQRELLKAKTREEWFKILDSGLRAEEKKALLVVLHNEFEHHPEVQRLLLQNADSEQGIRKRTADAVLAAAIAFAAGSFIGYKAGKQRKSRSKEPIRVQLVRSPPRKE